MQKFVVIVFDNDGTKALEALRILERLDLEAEIDLYDAQVVVKTPAGLTRVVREQDERALPLIGGGTCLGALIGLLGGPVGLAAGAAAGAAVGSIADIEKTGVTDEFVRDVSAALTPGKMAVVADIDEDFISPLDERMEALGGVVLRRVRTEVKSDQDDRDAAAYQSEVDALEAERQQARSDRLAKIDAKIDKVRSKLRAALERGRARMRAEQEERAARLDALEAKEQRATGEARKRRHARIAALRRDYAEKAAEVKGRFAA